MSSCDRHRTVRTLKAGILLSFFLIVSSSASAGAQAGGQQQAVQSTLPASLTDAEYWRIVTQFSEAGGNFSSDNFTSNELAIGQVATDLIKRGRFGGAYIGVGPEQNFTYIATLKPQIAFLVDIRRQAVMQQLMYKAIFEMSGNRAEFIARLFSKPLPGLSAADTSIRQIWSVFTPVPADSALFATNLAAIHHHLASVHGFTLSSADSASIGYVYTAFFRIGPGISYRGLQAGAGAAVAQANFASLTAVTDTAGVPRSFLASEENFHVVKTMHAKNLIIPVVGDFGGTQALRAVGDWLRARGSGATVNAFYTSNVEQYLFRPNDTWREFYRNVGFMPLDSSSVFIRPGLGSPFAASGATLYTTSARYTIAAVPPVPPVPLVQPQVVQLPTLGSITGVLRDSTTGRTVDRASIQISGTPHTAVTNVEGRFAMPNVAAGIHTLLIRRIGYAPYTLSDMRISAGTPTVVDIRLNPAPVILSGLVTTSASGFTVVSTSQGASATALCPIMEFLVAHNAGRVTMYADATRCVR